MSAPRRAWWQPRERQIEFPPAQTHSPLLAPILLGISLLCIVLVVILLFAYPDGPFIGPWG
jgi:hypothetical protein